ncbi:MULTISPECIES: LPXTG cell wall anchor domain-containing protein [Arthrobacter]|nr:MULTISPECIES: LPXTG cell wall anchor domain-containing protein [Arthrobacter]
MAATGANNTAAWLGGGILLLVLGSGALVFLRRWNQL